MLLEIKPEFLSKSELKKVVIERLLGDAYLAGSVLERVAEQVSLLVLHSVVEPSPERNLLYDVLDGALLGSLLLSLRSRRGGGYCTHTVSLGQPIRASFDFLLISGSVFDSVRGPDCVVDGVLGLRLGERDLLDLRLGWSVARSVHD